MIKSGKLFIVLLFAGVCLMASKKANAVPLLELWMTGELVGTELTVEIHRTNTDFGLGGLSYNLQFSESLYLSREYSDYGWVANDGVFDISNPVDIGAGGSASATLNSIRFDTVFNPPGSEFPAGTAGTVESLAITLYDLTPRWIYFDIVTPSASDGLGQNLETTLGGSINVISTIYPDPIPPSLDTPEPGHSLAYGVPEPTTLMLFGLGGLFLRKKRKT